MYTVRDVHTKIKAETLDILVAKNTDYRGGNREHIFSNFRRSLILNVQPTTGLMIRMLDKHQRIRAFINNGTLAVKNESVKDAVLDLHNYTSILHGMFSDVKDLDELTKVREGIYDVAESCFATSHFSDRDNSEAALDLLSACENNMSTRAICSRLLANYSIIGYILKIYSTEEK